MSELTPREIVRELDRYIIGQDDAKRAVAVALRNRWRRAQLPEDIRDEVTPKNILMIGPTGVGKTEIARRLAKLVDAPFVKVEATKFTEVGYVGRDVESMIRDLIEASIRLTKETHAQGVRARAAENTENRLVELLSGAVKKKPVNPIDILLGNKPKQPELSPEDRQKLAVTQDDVRTRLRRGELEHEIVEVEVEQSSPKAELPGGMDITMADMMGDMLPRKTRLRKVEVREARKILMAEEEQNLIDMDSVYSQAIERAEQHGIVFIDEIDKVAGRGSGSGPDVSREGVQRDILPIVEGSTVKTKYGPVRTDHMLFIAAGAFHVAKVTDLIPELQGRFPVRVDLLPLTKEDYKRILTTPENALIRQYRLLLGVDGVDLQFEESALDTIAELAWNDNETGENIGARRLHTLMEKLLGDIAFNAGGGDAPQVKVVIDAEYVKRTLHADLHMKDVRKYIL